MPIWAKGPVKGATKPILIGPFSAPNAVWWKPPITARNANKQVTVRLAILNFRPFFELDISIPPFGS
jgi:hypothetical protein